MYTRLASNLPQSLCLRLPNAGIADTHPYALPLVLVTIGSPLPSSTLSWSIMSPFLSPKDSMVRKASLLSSASIPSSQRRGRGRTDMTPGVDRLESCLFCSPPPPTHHHDIGAYGLGQELPHHLPLQHPLDVPEHGPWGHRGVLGGPKAADQVNQQKSQVCLPPISPSAHG